MLSAHGEANGINYTLLGLNEISVLLQGRLTSTVHTVNNKLIPPAVPMPGLSFVTSLYTFGVKNSAFNSCFSSYWMLA